MDDLNKKISDLLGSPDGMARIQSMMEALGIGGDGGESAPVSDSPIPAPAPETGHPRRCGAGRASGRRDAGLVGAAQACAPDGKPEQRR